MNLSGEKLEQLLISLVSFKKYYTSKLSNQELADLNEWIKILQFVEYVPVYNEHFVICAYFDESYVRIPNVAQFPNLSCVCQSVTDILRKFISLRRKYGVDEELQTLMLGLHI